MSRIADLEFFVDLLKHGSLAALARELGVTPPAVSARLAQLEKRLGVRLLNRTTRRISVTHEGELYLATGARLLGELEDLEQLVSNSRAVPRGRLRVNASFGFGRQHIAPAIAAFARRHPQVEVQLELTDRSLNLADRAFDVGIRFGEVPDSRLVARRVVGNRRLLCAAPSYLAEHGTPSTPRELQAHQCIVLRQNDSAFGTWHFTKGSRQETVKVRGSLTSNDGDAGVLWALEGFGIMMRSMWDIHAHVAGGQLVPVLEDWELPSADVYAVYLERATVPAKVTAFIDFLVAWFGREAAWVAPVSGQLRSQ